MISLVLLNYCLPILMRPYSWRDTNGFSEHKRTVTFIDVTSLSIEPVINTIRRHTIKTIVVFTNLLVQGRYYSVCLCSGILFKIHSLVLKFSYILLMCSCGLISLCWVSIVIISGHTYTANVFVANASHVNVGTSPLLLKHSLYLHTYSKQVISYVQTSFQQCHELKQTKYRCVAHKHT